MEPQPEPDLIIDKSEKQVGYAMLTAARERGFTAEVRPLVLGDYYWTKENITIERKEIGDFMSSMQTGHLEDQLVNMRQCEHAYLFIHGRAAKCSQYYTEKQKTGAILSAHLRYPGVTTIWWDTFEQFRDAVFAIPATVEKGQKTESLERHTYSWAEQNGNLRMYANTPGLGKDKALKWHDRFPRYLDFVAAYREGEIGTKKKGDTLPTVTKQHLDDLVATA